MGPSRPRRSETFDSETGREDAEGCGEEARWGRAGVACLTCRTRSAGAIAADAASRSHPRGAGSEDERGRPECVVMSGRPPTASLCLGHSPHAQGAHPGAGRQRRSRGGGVRQRGQRIKVRILRAGGRVTSGQPGSVVNDRRARAPRKPQNREVEGIGRGWSFRRMWRSTGALRGT